MEFYKFDQDNIGKYQDSNIYARKTLDMRIHEISLSLRKALRLQMVMGVLFTVSALALFQPLYCAPLYVSILWIFLWGTTLLRTYFCIHGLWKQGIKKEQRQKAFFRIRRLIYAQLIILLWFLITVGFYCSLGMGVLFVGNIVIIGIALTSIAYAFSYMTCSQKNLRWWEFSNDTEGYWRLGE